jgi:four helix bundle protein
MSYKFEKLEVWKLSLAYTDSLYRLADQLPKAEEFNLKSQMLRAANSIALNIAEGSTSISDNEKSRYIRIAIGSLLETVACLHLINRRKFIADNEILKHIYIESETLFRKLQCYRKVMK